MRTGKNLTGGKASKPREKHTYANTPCIIPHAAMPVPTNSSGSPKLHLSQVMVALVNTKTLEPKVRIAEKHATHVLTSPYKRTNHGRGLEEWRPCSLAPPFPGGSSNRLPGAILSKCPTPDSYQCIRREEGSTTTRTGTKCVTRTSASRAIRGSRYTDGCK